MGETSVASGDGLRNTDTVFTAKEVLVQLTRTVEGIDLKVDGIDQKVSIVVAADLPRRVDQLESWVDRLKGFALVATILGAVSTGIVIVDRVF